MSIIESTYSTNLRFNTVGSGDIRGFADGCRLLIESATRISALVLGIGAEASEVNAFAKRLEYGIPLGGLSLIDLDVSLNRGDILNLLNAGLSSPESILAISIEQLTELIGSKGAALRLAAMRHLSLA
jgi:hypothetical protein